MNLTRIIAKIEKVLPNVVVREAAGLEFGIILDFGSEQYVLTTQRGVWVIYGGSSWDKDPVKLAVEIARKIRTSAERALHATVMRREMPDVSDFNGPDDEDVHVWTVNQWPDVSLVSGRAPVFVYIDTGLLCTRRAGGDVHLVSDYPGDTEWKRVSLGEEVLEEVLDRIVEDRDRKAEELKVRLETLGGVTLKVQGEPPLP
jgi:hypothetical protein